MTMKTTRVNPETLPKADPLAEQLERLRLPYIRDHYEALARQAPTEPWSPLESLAKLIEGEAHQREDRRIERLIQTARFPVLKTLDPFNWSWPKKINRLPIHNLFRLTFIEEKANICFLGSVGVGKSHLSVVLGYTACLHGYSVLFTTAIEIINTPSAAQATGHLKRELGKYLKPKLLILDELGYLPIDKQGADSLFQITTQRYERGSIILTSNRAYQHWPEIFNHDSTLTSALLDRLLHHAETVLIEGKSYPMKDQIEP